MNRPCKKIKRIVIGFFLIEIFFSPILLAERDDISLGEAPKMPVENPLFGQMNRRAVEWVAFARAEAGLPKLDINGDGEIDVRDVTLIVNAFGVARRGEKVDLNQDGVVDIFDLVPVAKHVGEKVPIVPVGAPVGVGELAGRPIGFFGGAFASVKATEQGAITVKAELTKDWGFASWGFDFFNPVDARDKILVVNVKGPNGSGMRLQFRDKAWHDAGRFGQVQAKSPDIEFTGDWQRVEIDLAKITANGINMRELWHIAIEYGADFLPNNKRGLTFQIGDPEKNIAGFLLVDKKPLAPLIQPQAPAPLEIGPVEKIPIAKHKNWLDQNKSSKNIPFSFQVPQEKGGAVWQLTRNEHERMVLSEGLVIYDGALAQVLELKMGDTEKAFHLTEILHRASLGELNDLSAYHDPGNINEHPFIYSNDPGDVNAKGEGFRFKIINAEGHWKLKDPLTGEIVTWSQWQPIAGENAWAGVIAPMHLYQQEGGVGEKAKVSLELAEEVARSAILLQAENGGIRMAPKGTWHESGDLDWFYNEQSVENNLSWYAAFRMLYEATGEQKYRVAMNRIEGYLRSMFDREKGVFVQGSHWNPQTGVWEKAPRFATDVQTWAILTLGVEKIDQWFGEGTSYRMLQKMKQESGVFDEGGKLMGVDFTNYRLLGRDPIVSVEWTAGAILAARRAAKSYEGIHPEWASELRNDADSMHRYVQTLRVETADRVAYPYASGRGPSAARPTGFGWDAVTEEVLSTASTVWMAFVEEDFNPLGGESAGVLAMRAMKN